MFSYKFSRGPRTREAAILEHRRATPLVPRSPDPPIQLIVLFFFIILEESSPPSLAKGALPGCPNKAEELRWRSLGVSKTSTPQIPFQLLVLVKGLRHSPICGLLNSSRSRGKGHQRVRLGGVRA
jgi:hypothetical protein